MKFSLRKRTVSEKLMAREGVNKSPKITESNRQDHQAQETEQGQGGKKCVFSIASGCRSFVAGCVITKKKRSCSTGQVCRDACPTSHQVESTSVPCERGFSAQNRVHSSSRNRLNPASVES